MSEMGLKLRPPSCLLGEACLLRAKEWGRKLAPGTSFGPRAGRTSPFDCPHMPHPLSSLATCISQPTNLLMSKPGVGGRRHFSASSENTFQPPLLLLETLCSPAVCEAQSPASLWSLQLLPSSFPLPASPPHHPASPPPPPPLIRSPDSRRWSSRGSSLHPLICPHLFLGCALPVPRC